MSGGKKLRSETWPGPAVQSFGGTGENVQVSTCGHAGSLLVGDGCWRWGSQEESWRAQTLTRAGSAARNESLYISSLALQAQLTPLNLQSSFDFILRRLLSKALAARQ